MKVIRQTFVLKLFAINWFKCFFIMCFFTSFLNATAQPIVNRPSKFNSDGNNKAQNATGNAIETVLPYGLNAYGQLVIDPNAQTNQYGAKATGKGKTQYGQIFSYISGGLMPLNFTAYEGSGVKPAIPSRGNKISIGTVTQINYDEVNTNILNTERNSLVQVHFTGNVICPGIEGTSKTITFMDISDDGFMLSINNNNVISNWEEQGPKFYNGSGTVTLTAGNSYPIDIWYYQNGDYWGVKLFWDIGDGKGPVIVPAVNTK